MSFWYSGIGFQKPFIKQIHMAVYMGKFILNLIWDSLSIYISSIAVINPYKNNIEEEGLYLPWISSFYH